MAEDMEREQVRRGEWVRQKGNPEAICSECGREVVYQCIDNRWRFENYCPHCGTRMIGKENLTMSDGTLFVLDQWVIELEKVCETIEAISMALEQDPASAPSGCLRLPAEYLGEVCRHIREQVNDLAERGGGS